MTGTMTGTMAAASEDNGYTSDNEEYSRSEMQDSCAFHLDGIFDSDDDGLSTSSKEVMPPPSFKCLSSTDSSSSSKEVMPPPSVNGLSRTDSSSSSDEIPSGEGYDSGESKSTSDESDVDYMWEVAYLGEKRRLLTRACHALKQVEEYDASIAMQVASASTGDTPLWVEAKQMMGIGCSDSKAVPRKRGSLLGKRPRIDLSSVYHVNGYIEGQENLIPWLRVAENETSGVAASVSLDCGDSENTMDLEHAIAFSTVAQVLAQAFHPRTIVHANRAFSEFSGLATEELVGHTLSSIIIEMAKQDAHKQGSQSQFVDAFLHVSVSSGNVDGPRTCRMRTVSIRDAPKPSLGKTHSPITHLLVQVQ